MKKEIEKEIKYQLTEKDFKEFEKYIESSNYRRKECKHQVNYYIDTKEFLLMKNKITLRLRQMLDDNSFQLTLKIPKEKREDELVKHVKVKNEYTISLNNHQADEILNNKIKNYTNLLENYVPILKDENIVNELKVIGKLYTERKNYLLDEDDSVLSLDRSEYLDVEDYEIEWEAKDLNKASSFLNNIFEKLNITPKDKFDSKNSRFIRKLKDYNPTNIKIISELVENTDKYSPREISCFHKTWAIICNSFHHKYFEYFLLYAVLYENFMVDDYFSWESFRANLDTNFDRFAKEVLKEKLNINIEKVQCDEQSFDLKIREAINNNYRVLVPVNLIDVPYYPNYLIESHIHFIPIKGYDHKRRLYYILDNMQIDNGSGGIYKDFVMTFELMNKINGKCFHKYFTNAPSRYFWIAYERDEDKLHTKKVLNDLCGILKSINDRKHTIKFAEEDLLQGNYKKIVSFKRAYAKILNYREVFYDVLFKLMSEVKVSDDEITILKNMKKKVTTQWEEIRTKILYFASKKPEKILKLCDLIEDSIAKEAELRNYIIHIIDQKQLTSDINESTANNYSVRILNNYNAEIIKEDSVIIIKHLDTMAYDTWFASDNAAQLLFTINKEDSIEIQCKVVLENNTDYPFFGGMIIKTKDKGKYLFGNEANVSISLYHPNNLEDFLIASNNYFCKSVILKLIIQGDKGSFYFKENGEAKEWVLLKQMIISNIFEVGLISKTWGEIQHTTLFTDIETKVNDEYIEIYC